MMLCCGLCFATTACDDSVDDPSKVTYFAEITLEGGAELGTQLGSTFADPGYKATEGDADITKNVKINGTVNTEETGRYVLDYSVSNQDGFSTSAQRVVYVYDPAVTDDLSGTYEAKGNRVSGGTTQDFGPFQVTIKKKYNGIFSLSDFLGGYYDQGREYGEAYALSGYFALGASNSVKALYGMLPGFGDTYTNVEGSINEEGKISMKVLYAGMEFNYELTKMTE